MNSQQQQQLHHQRQHFITTTQTISPSTLYVASTGGVQMQVQVDPVGPSNSYIPMRTTAGNISMAETFQSRTSRRLGMSLIVIAVLAIPFNIVALAQEDTVALVGHGFWSSFMVSHTFVVYVGQCCLSERSECSGEELSVQRSWVIRCCVKTSWNVHSPCLRAIGRCSAVLRLCIIMFYIPSTLFTAVLSLIDTAWQDWCMVVSCSAKYRL